MAALGTFLADSLETSNDAPTARASTGSDPFLLAVKALGEQQAAEISTLLDQAIQAQEMTRRLAEPALVALASARFAEISQTITRLAASWKVLGGTIRFHPPEAVGGPATLLVPVTVTPGPMAQPISLPPEPPPPAPPLPAQVADPTPVRPPLRPLLDPLPTPVVTAPVAPRVDGPPRERETYAANWSTDLADLLANALASPNAQEEMERIQRTANLSFTRWNLYPRSVQRALVGNLACRLRHLQDHLGVSGPKLDGAFRSLTRYSKSFQPGWVNGLTRGRGPAADSWAEEARCWWDQLAITAGVPDAPPPTAEVPPSTQAMDEALADVRRWLDEWRGAPLVAKPMCLEKTLDAIRRTRRLGIPVTDPDLCQMAGEIYDHLEVPDFLRLRQAIRDLENAEREETEGQEPDPIPTDWPWWSHTIGRHVALVGDEPAATTKNRLETNFGFSGPRWIRCRGEILPPPLDRDHVTSFDLVVVFGHYVDATPSHQLIRTCQEMGVSWVLVERGQGVTRTRMAIERYLQPETTPNGRP